MIHRILKESGFTDGYLLPLDAYEDWTRRRSAGVFHPNAAFIADDAGQDMPWANAWVLCLLVYPPNGVDAPVSSNYITANTLYHMTRAFVDRLNAAGIRSARVDVPIRTLAAQAGVGAVLKNAQLAIPPYGTRVSLQAVYVYAGDSPVFDSPPVFASPCVHCHACQKACPSGAIDDGGYHWQRCVRAYMDDPEAPAWAMEKTCQLMGCELCQNVCPVNAGLPVVPLSEPTRAAFALERLLGGDCAAARALVGKNISANKLMRQAALVAGTTGRSDLLPQLSALAETGRADVARAASFAITLLRAGENACTMDASHQTGS